MHCPKTRGGETAPRTDALLGHTMSYSGLFFREALCKLHVRARAAFMLRCHRTLPRQVCSTSPSLIGRLMATTHLNELKEHGILTLGMIN